jgi:Asp-tRNA(Asn)/Glu-tRNA(Gln) amidotransferase B subunit
MAELPTAKRARYMSLGLPRADVLILADELATADFFDATMAAGAPAKAAANWIMGDIMAACKVLPVPSGVSVSQAAATRCGAVPRALAQLSCSCWHLSCVLNFAKIAGRQQPLALATPTGT